MKETFKIITAGIGLALATALQPTQAADSYDTLKIKTQILVDQAKELAAETRRADDHMHAAAYQYYCTLMVSTGTNLLARSESPTNAKLLQSYLTLISKDYEAYTKYSDAASMAEATGRKRGHTGDRQREKRRINAEKLGDKELEAAIKRWEKFAAEVKRKPR